MSAPDRSSADVLADAEQIAEVHRKRAVDLEMEIGSVRARLREEMDANARLIEQRDHAMACNTSLGKVLDDARAQAPRHDPDLLAALKGQVALAERLADESSKHLAQLRSMAEERARVAEAEVERLRGENATLRKGLAELGAPLAIEAAAAERALDAAEKAARDLAAREGSGDPALTPYSYRPNVRTP